MHSEQDIGRIIAGHFRRLDDERSLYQLVQDAADNKLWGSAMTSVFGPGVRKLKVKRQVNTVRPFVDRMKAALYSRAPRITVAAPKVRPATGRAKQNPDHGEALSELATELVRQPGFRKAFEAALEAAIVMPGCALKFGWVDGDVPVSDRVFVDVVPRWYAGWDPNADEGREAWRFHIRWELFDTAKEVLPELADEHKTTISPWLENGQAPSSKVDDQARQYVQVVEWWDLVEQEVQVFHLTDTTVHCRGSKPEKIRYFWPNGKPICQLVPVILANRLGCPRDAVSMVLPVFEETLEKSLILSLVLSAFRRDAARVLMYLKKQGISEASLKAITDADDLELVGVELGANDNRANLAELFVNLQMPDLANTWKHAQELVSMASADSSTLSGLGRGKVSGLEYAAATTAQALTSGDAATASLPAERMMTYVVEVVSAVFCMFSKNQTSLRIDIGEAEVTINSKHLGQPWTITAEDVASASANRQAFKTESMQVIPVLGGLMAQAMQTVDPQSGQPVDPSMAIAAERMVDLLVEQFALPDRLRVSKVRKAGEAKVKAREKIAELEGPVEAEEPESVEVDPMAQDDAALAQEMAANATPEDLAAMQVLQQLPPEALERLRQMQIPGGE